MQSQRPIVIAFKQSAGYQVVLEGADRHGAFADTHTSQIGHAVLVFGYSESEQAFKVRDSRGSDIGDSGEWWLPVSLAGDDNFISEAAYIEELPH